MFLLNSLKYVMPHLIACLGFPRIKHGAAMKPSLRVKRSNLGFHKKIATHPLGARNDKY